MLAMLVLFSFSCLLKFASSLQRSAYSQSHRLVLQKTANSLSLAPLRRSYVLHTTALASARNSVGTAALFSRNFTTGKRSRRGFDTKMIEKGTATDSATTIGTGTISETSDAPFVVKERKDGSYMVKCHEDEYERLFDEKLASLTGLLGWHGEVDKFASEKSHFRMRANFNVWHDNRKEQTPSGAFYAMFDEVDKRQVCEIKSFPRGSKRINELMDGLMEVFRQSNLMFQTVFEVRFLTTLSCESLIVLLYRRPIPDEWLAEAEKAAAQLMCKIVGRSRNKKVEAGGEDIVRETLHVKGRDYHYFQTEGAFSQPNAKVCEKMLTWASDMTENSHGEDLLELYCGGGTFTAALATNFRQVLATEVSKASVALANRCFEANNISNIKVARLSSEEFTEAYKGKKNFERLAISKIVMKDYAITTVLVDPPRAGLDADTCKLISQFDKIVYISCNPETLARDVAILADTHEVKRVAAFDQFPYTHHLESGVYLVKKANSDSSQPSKRQKVE